MTTTPPSDPATDHRGDEPHRTVLRDVRIFDGAALGEPTTVAVEGPVISADPGSRGARVIDGAGAVLLPGLIDAHIHLHGRDTLGLLCSWGVTTGLDMATWPVEKLTPLRGAVGLTDIRSPGMPAIGPGGVQAHIPGMPPGAIQEDPAGAPAFVAGRPRCLSSTGTRPATSIPTSRSTASGTPTTRGSTPRPTRPSRLPPSAGTTRRGFRPSASCSPERTMSGRFGVSLHRPLADYFRENISYTGSGDTTQRLLRWTVEMVGVERILMATDYPFIDNSGGAPRQLLDRADLTDTERDALASGNWDSLRARH